MRSAGLLRERGNLMVNAAAPNAANPSYTDTFMAGVPCSIATVSGDETFRGRQLQAGLTHVVEMQRLNGVQADMRLDVTAGPYRGRIFNVVHVRDMTGDGTPHRMQLYCRETAPVG